MIYGSYDYTETKILIGLHELNELKQSITAIVFRKDEYTMESIIRWIMDRGFSFDNFLETEKYYFIKQPPDKDFDSYNYEKIRGDNIAVELGINEETDNTARNELDDLIGG